MGNELAGLLTASIFKKQIVAVTGLAMAGFVVLHLAGNLLIFGGPEVFNAYAAGLRRLGPVLWMMRLGLVASAVAHVVFTVWLALENWRARGTPYAVVNDFGSTSFAKKTMIYTGLLVFLFLFHHLANFSLADKTGPASVVAELGEGGSLGLYGLVWRSFLKPWQVIVYVLAVCCVGLHVSHGIESFFQTLGAKPEGYAGMIRKVSVATGILVGVGFSTIPAYVIIRHFALGAGV